MAGFDVRDDGFSVRLTGWEKAGAFHGDIDVSWGQVERVDEVDDVWAHLRGLRAPGTGWPGVIMLGTMRRSGEKDFCVVYGHRPGVIIHLTGHEFARLLLTAPDADTADLDVEELRREP